MPTAKELKLTFVPGKECGVCIGMQLSGIVHVYIIVCSHSRCPQNYDVMTLYVIECIA